MTNINKSHAFEIPERNDWRFEASEKQYRLLKKKTLRFTASRCFLKKRKIGKYGSFERLKATKLSTLLLTERKAAIKSIQFILTIWHVCFSI